MIRYREAEPRDVPTLRAMLQALSDHDGGTGEVGPEAGLLTHGFGKRRLLWAVIAEEDAALGMVIYYPEYSTHRGEPGVYVQDIYVSDAARGLGVGKGLLAKVMAVQDWDARFITLGVSAENSLANGFYRRLGFRKRGYEFLILDGDGLKSLL